MTSVMRAAAAPVNAARVPRVAVVRQGRIVDEVLIKDPDQVVTVGTSERARVVVRGAVGLPESFQLLERAGQRYFLRFHASMAGRVIGATGIATLAELGAQAHPTPDGAFRVLLSEDARGKVVIGDTTFLFQLVVPPPPALRPQLPLGVKNGVGLDWSLTIIAAFSFLIHFGIAGAMYSDWMDPIVATDHVALGIVDDLSRLPRPTPETPSDPTPTKEATSDAPPTSTASAKSAPGTKRSANSTKSNASHESVSERQASLLASQADSIEVGWLTAKSNGPSVGRALDASNIPPVDLSSAAERNIAASHDNHGGLHVASGGPVATSKSSLGSLAGDGHNTASTSAGPESATAGPSIQVSTLPPSMNQPLSDADRAIAKLRPRFKRCYQQGLAINPDMSGKATIVAKVGPNGEVLSSEIGSNEGLSSTVTSCLTSAVTSYAQFTGNGSVTTIRIPVSLVHQ